MRSSMRCGRSASTTSTCQRARRASGPRSANRGQVRNYSVSLKSAHGGFYLPRLIRKSFLYGIFRAAGIFEARLIGANSIRYARDSSNTKREEVVMWRSISIATAVIALAAPALALADD